MVCGRYLVRENLGPGPNVLRTSQTSAVHQKRPLSLKKASRGQFGSQEVQVSNA